MNVSREHLGDICKRFGRQDQLRHPDCNAPVALRLVNDKYQSPARPNLLHIKKSFAKKFGHAEGIDGRTILGHGLFLGEQG